MSKLSDDEDCFVSINIDGNKLMMNTGTGCIGIKFGEEMGDYVYLSFTETKLLVHALQATAERLLEQMEDCQ